MNKLLLFIISCVMLVISCGIQTQIPVTPTPAQDTQLTSRAYPRPLSAPVPDLSRQVCETAESVNLRTCAGTGCELVTVLSAGDPLTLTGEIVTAPDGGAWWPVDANGLAGWINTRYVCIAV